MRFLRAVANRSNHLARIFHWPIDFESFLVVIRIAIVGCVFAVV